MYIFSFPLWIRRLSARVFHIGGSKFIIRPPDSGTLDLVLTPA